MLNFEFKCALLLKKPPYYILTLGEEEAANLCEKYKDDVVGLFCSDTGIAFKQMKQKISFFVPEIRAIEFNQENDETIIEEEENESAIRQINVEVENVPSGHIQDNDGSDKLS